MKRLFIFAMVLLSLTLVAFQVEEFTSVEQFLVWVATGGGSMVLAGAVIALLLENWPAWHNFPKWVKIITPIVLAGIFGTLASAALALELPAMIPPVLATLILVMLNWLGSQWQYMRAKNLGCGADAG
jgi:hypothetical protein